MTKLVHPGYDPGDDTLFLPDYFIAERARRMGVPAYQLLEPEYAQNVLAVAGRAEAKDLAYRLGGRAVKPTRELVLVGPDGRTPIVVPGLGVTEAAELEEVAIAAYEKREKLMRQGKPLVDFDELRDREGLPPAKEFDPLFRQALRDRIEKHRRSPITDPPRQPVKPRGLIPVAKPQEETEIA